MQSHDQSTSGNSLSLVMFSALAGRIRSVIGCFGLRNDDSWLGGEYLGRRRTAVERKVENEERRVRDREREGP